MHKSQKPLPHPASHARAMREKVMSVALKRKEEYLGARVPKALKDKVIHRADELGIPVSLLLRKVLEEVFSEEQTLLKLDLIKNKVVSRVEVSENNYADILAWKEIQLNRSKECECCGENQEAGSHVMMGIGAGNDRTPIVCTTCQIDIIKKSHA